MKQALHKQKDLLRDALQDLDKELKALQEAKRTLQKQFGDHSRELDVLKQQQLRLRNLISLSMKKETLILKRKAKAKEKLSSVEEKIKKVRSVERELAEM